MANELGLYTNANGTWTNLSSAASGFSGTSAISSLQTSVTALENGLVAQAGLSTMVQNEVQS